MTMHTLHERTHLQSAIEEGLADDEVEFDQPIQKYLAMYKKQKKT